MVEWGMPALDALRAATANGAELLRLPDAGTIESGKRADLLLVDGDPVDDPRTLLGRRRTWQAGLPV
jgi:imidazolonepropionase-like amidohydrolase